jgi:hypothetical protein
MEFIKNSFINGLNVSRQGFEKFWPSQKQKSRSEANADSFINSNVTLWDVLMIIFLFLIVLFWLYGVPTFIKRLIPFNYSRIDPYSLEHLTISAAPIKPLTTNPTVQQTVDRVDPISQQLLTRSNNIAQQVIDPVLKDLYYPAQQTADPVLQDLYKPVQQTTGTVVQNTSSIIAPLQKLANNSTTVIQTTPNIGDQSNFVTNTAVPSINAPTFKFIEETDTLPNVNYDSLIQNSDVLPVLPNNGAPTTTKSVSQNISEFPSFKFKSSNLPQGTLRNTKIITTPSVATLSPPVLGEVQKSPTDELFSDLTVYNNIYKEGKRDYDDGFPTISPILVRTGLSLCYEKCPGTCVEYGYTGISNCFVSKI